MKNYIFNIDDTLNRIKKTINQKRLSDEEKKFLLYKFIVLSKLNLLAEIRIDKDSNKLLEKKFKTKLTSDEFSIDFKKNKISLNFNTIIIKILKINLRHIQSIFVILLNIFSFKKINCILLFGDMFKNSNIKVEDLNNFFYKYKNLFQIKNEKVIFNHNLKNLDNDRYIFKKNSLLFLVSHYLTVKEKINLIFILFFQILYINLNVFINSYKVYIFEEYINLKFLQILNEKKIISKIFFFHISAINSLPLWTFYKEINLQKNYIFDSLSNLHPLKFNNKFISNTSFIPQMQFINFQKIFISDDRLKLFFDKKKTKFIKIKPFSYNIKRRKLNLKTKNNICIFDVNEGKVPKFLNNYEIKFNNYYSQKNILNFLNSILTVVKKINLNNKVKIYCYIKRKPNFGRNLSQLNNIKILQKKYDFFKILHPQTDIENYYNLFKTTISFPNTSQSIYFSKITNKESIYYDIENSLVNKYDKKVSLISNELSLQKKIKNIFSLND